jgi:ribonuclease Z
VKITHDILDYHTTPVEAAEIARDAGVGYLLYNHIVPPLPLPSMEEIFLDGVAETWSGPVSVGRDETWSGPVSVGRDGTLVRLPADSEVIELDELL